LGAEPEPSKVLFARFRDPVESDVKREKESNGEKHKVEEGRNDDCHTSIGKVASFSIKFWPCAGGRQSLILPVGHNNQTNK